MPYIKQELRDRLIPKDFTPVPETSGELNFVITEMCDSYLAGKGKNYSNINEVIGALECAKLEFYRRIAAPYEDLKIKENGDVYTS